MQSIFVHLVIIKNELHYFSVCSPPAIERLSSGLFQEVIITNTIPVLEQNYFPQLTVLSVANLLGETIWRVHDDCSVSSSFSTHGSLCVAFDFENKTKLKYNTLGHIRNLNFEKFEALEYPSLPKKKKIKETCMLSMLLIDFMCVKCFLMVRVMFFLVWEQ